MFEYPQYEDNGQEFVHYPNIWRDITPQPMVGADCFLPFANVNNGMNRFVMDITGEDFRKMFSSLMNGSQFTYPQEWMQIIVNFLKMVHCPIDFEEECQEYPTYTPIVQYSPMSPFIDPDEVPEGYLVPPFVFVSDENIGEYTDFQVGDVIAPLNSFPLDTGWFENLNENLPSFTITIEGEGSLSIKFLNIPQGGLVIVTVDNPPNLIDILAGIVTGADNIIDLNLDIVSVPPETAQEHVYPLEITGAGMHTVYCVFFPIIDDSLIPLRFGGGFRSFELCDFGELPDMGVTDIRFVLADKMLQQQKLGVYEDVIDWEGFKDYLIDIENSVTAVEGDLDNLEITVLDTEENVSDLTEWVGDIATLQATHDTSIANLASRMDTAESDIDALDARLTALEAADSTMWSVHYNFKTGEHGFGGGSGVTWTSGVGYSWSTSPIIIAKTDSSFLDGRIAFYRLELSKGGAGEQDYTVKIVDDLYSYGVAESGLNIRYHKLQSLSTRQDLEIQFAAAGSWILEGLTIFGYGDSNAYDD